MQITENIYNVGTEHNNAYLVKGEKTALIDTPIFGNYIENVEKIIPVSEIDYLVINHSEYDRVCYFAEVLEKNPNIEVVATAATLRNLKLIFNIPFKEHLAKDEAMLDLGGGYGLKFLITPNLNWPDTMVTLEMKTKTLFSCELFGEIEEQGWSKEKYYKEILSHYNEYVENAIYRLREYDISLICPGDGAVIKKEDIEQLYELYLKLCVKKERTGKKVLVVFATVSENTEEMAMQICDTLSEYLDDKQHPIELLAVDALYDGDEESIEKINNADAVIIGTPTIHKNVDIAIRQLLIKLDPIKLRHKPFFTFGSYGWSGEGAQIVHNLLQSFGMRAFSKPFTSIFTLSDERRQELIEHTRKFVGFIYK